MPLDKWIKRRYRHFVVYMISHSEKSKVCRCGNIILGDPSMTIPIQNKTQNITRKNVFTRHGKITFVGKSACRCGWGGRRLTGKVACVFSSPKLQQAAKGTCRGMLCECLLLLVTMPLLILFDDCTNMGVHDYMIISDSVQSSLRAHLRSEYSHNLHVPRRGSSHCLRR